MNPFLIFIGGFLIGAIINELIHWYFISLTSWFSTKEREQCAYEIKLITNPTIHQIEVTKRFGKISKINCYWFNRREIRPYNSVEYKHCPYGETFLNRDSGFSIRQCPFDKKDIK